MLKIRKNEPIETVTPGVFYSILSTPDDSPKEAKKNYYIVNVIDRRHVGVRAYSVETKVFDAGELRTAFGLSKREYIEIIA